jgi:hypothetical protein
MTPVRRDTQFKARLSEDERTMLEALAEKAGLSASDIVRTLIRREYAREFGDSTPRRRRRR